MIMMTKSDNAIHNGRRCRRCAIKHRLIIIKPPTLIIFDIQPSIQSIPVHIRVSDGLEVSQDSIIFLRESGDVQGFVG